MGYCDAETYTIYLRDGMCPQATAATFYHELVHAVLFSMGKMNHDEEFVEAFAVFLHQFTETKT